MKCTYTFAVILSVTISLVITQDPPPAIDLPPPPPFDTPVTTIEEAVSADSNAPTSAVENASVATNETAMNTTVLDTTGTVNKSDSTRNDSLLESTDLALPVETFAPNGTNETVVANVKDIIIDNVSDTSINKSSVQVSGNDTGAVNITDIAATDQAISDILAAAAAAASTASEQIPNGTNVLSDIVTNNVTSFENIDALTSNETQNRTQNEISAIKDSNVTITENVIDPLIDSNVTDPLTQTIPVDLPPPPISFDSGFESEFSIGGLGTNNSSSAAQPSTEIPLPFDTYNTSEGNTTFIDQIDPYVNETTGNMLIKQTSMRTVGTKTTIGQVPFDLPPVPVPVDLPPPPVDSLSVDFIEKPGMTTIEISDLLAGIGSMVKSSTPMDNVNYGMTTIGLTISQPDASINVPVYETTTSIPQDLFTTPSSFNEYTTTTYQPVYETKDPVYTHVPKIGVPPPPDHPPPIFSGGSRPSVYTDQYGPFDGQFPLPETTTSKIKVIATKEAPPPPIMVPTRPNRFSNWAGQRSGTTVSPYHKWAAQTPSTTSTLNPRYMNVAELAAYALEISNKRKQTNRPNRGIQVFFPTEPQTKTTQRPPTTPFKPVYKQVNKGPQKDYRSNAFVEYLRKRYGISNIGTTPAYHSMTVKPVVSTWQKQGNRNFYDAKYLLSHLPEATTQKPTTKKFYDSNYLLSHLDNVQSKPVVPYLQTTQKPTHVKQFYDASYLLSHLGELQQPKSHPQSMLPPKQQQTYLPQQTDIFRQNSVSEKLKTQVNKRLEPQIGSGHIQSILKQQRQGQVETRPINLKTDLNPQSFINYNINPEQNAIRNLNQLQQKQTPFSKQSGNTFKPFTGMTSFKPVIYGNNPFQITKKSPGLTLRERFNRKWYRPDSQTPAKETTQIETSSVINEPIRNINIQIEEPINSNKVITAPVSPVKTLFSRLGQNQNIGNGMHKDASNRDIAIQQNSIETQRLILRQQEEKLRQQQQKLHEQQELLRLQEEKHLQQQLQTQQLQNNNPQQQEQGRLYLLRLQRQAKEQDRLRLLKQQQQEQHKHEENVRLLQQQLQQQQKQQLLKQQQARNFQQQQAQKGQLLEQKSQHEQELLRRQLFQGQANQLPLASRTGRSEILQNNRINTKQRQQTYQPEVQLSSIQIFRAPAMIRKRHNQVRNEAPPKKPQTHWRAPSDLKHLHGHLSVQYKVKPKPVRQTTQATPSPSVSVINTPLPTVYIGTMATTVRPITTSTRPTVPPTADPNPPPIFDTKVRHTFMPMPKFEPTTKAPKQVGNTDGTQSNSQQSNLHMDERCRGCVFVNDRCLLPDPVHCHFYIECVKQGPSVRSFSRECALGSFFDRKSFLCVDPKNADCPTDRCRIPGTKWYAIHGHCKHYWACGSREGGGYYAQSECCPDMGGFVEPIGCVENPNCTDTCSSTIVKDGPTELTCLPKLFLPFNGSKIEDSSNTKQHIGVEGISSTLQGEAIYKGAGKLVLWRYANLMFPLVFAMKFRFYSTASSPRKQIIFSNCNPMGGLEPSIEISLDTMFNEVVFEINTYKGPSKRFTIIYQQKKWTSVDFIYDGERIVGSVDRRARNIFAGGGIETRPNPIVIGTCNGKDGFKGLLDDVFVYEDCIPDDMYGIFMSVLE